MLTTRNLSGGSPSHYSYLLQILGSITTSLNDHIRAWFTVKYRRCPRSHRIWRLLLNILALDEKELE